MLRCLDFQFSTENHEHNSRFLLLCLLVTSSFFTLKVMFPCHPSCPAQTATSRDRRAKRVTREKGPKVENQPDRLFCRVKNVTAATAWEAQFYLQMWQVHMFYLCSSSPVSRPQRCSDETTPSRPKRRKVAGDLLTVLHRGFQMWDAVKYVICDHIANILSLSYFHTNNLGWL